MPITIIHTNVKTPLVVAGGAFEFSRGLAKGVMDNEYLHPLTV